MTTKLEGVEPDPIFALMAEHQDAYDRMEALYDPTDEDNPAYLDADNVEFEKLKFLVVAKPKTYAGLVAFAENAVSCEAGMSSWFPHSDEPAETALATISQLLRNAPEVRT